MAEEEKNVKKTLEEYIDEEVDNTQMAKFLLARIYNHITMADFKGSDTLISLDDGSLWLIQGVRVGKETKSDEQPMS